MELFATKTDFFINGAKACRVPDDSPECPICRNQFASEPSLAAVTPIITRILSGHGPFPGLQVSITQTPPPTTEEEDHTPIKMHCCKNVFCYNCLNQWLENANTCPLCRAELFPPEVVEVIELEFIEYHEGVDDADADNDSEEEDSDEDIDEISDDEWESEKDDGGDPDFVVEEMEEVEGV